MVAMMVHCPALMLEGRRIICKVRGEYLNTVVRRHDARRVDCSCGRVRRGWQAGESRGIADNSLPDTHCYRYSNAIANTYRDTDADAVILSADSRSVPPQSPDTYRCRTR